jgi:hypothetical protein
MGIYIWNNNTARRGVGGDEKREREMMLMMKRIEAVPGSAVLSCWCFTSSSRSIADLFSTFSVSGKIWPIENYFNNYRDHYMIVFIWPSVELVLSSMMVERTKIVYDIGYNDQRSFPPRSLYTYSFSSARGTLAHSFAPSIDQSLITTATFVSMLESIKYMCTFGYIHNLIINSLYFLLHKWCSS